MKARFDLCVPKNKLKAFPFDLEYCIYLKYIYLRYFWKERIERGEKVVFRRLPVEDFGSIS